jgi:hypothetical protein
VSPSRVDALSQDLAEALTAELEVEAVGGLGVRRRLPVEGLPSACVATPACITDISRRLDVSQLLIIAVVDTGGSIQIDSTWFEPATGKSASRPAIDLAVIAEAKAKFVSSAALLLPDATVRPRSKGLDGKMVPAVPRHFTRPALVTAAVALVGVGAGIGFGLRARSAFKDCDALGPLCGKDARDSIRNKALIADIGWAVAIGGAAATAVLFMTSSREPHLVVEPSPSGVAVTAIGRF